MTRQEHHCSKWKRCNHSIDPSTWRWSHCHVMYYMCKQPTRTWRPTERETSQFSDPEWDLYCALGTRPAGAHMQSTKGSIGILFSVIPVSPFNVFTSLASYPPMLPTCSAHVSLWLLGKTTLVPTSINTSLNWVRREILLGTWVEGMFTIELWPTDYPKTMHCRVSCWSCQLLLSCHFVLKLYRIQRCIPSVD